MSRRIPYSLTILVIIVSLACGFAPRRQQQTPAGEVSNLPAESLPTQAPAATMTLVPATPTPKPTETRKPTATTLPTNTPAPTRVEYVITDTAFDVEVEDTCNTDAVIQNVDGSSFEVGGQLSIVNGVMTIWCYDAKHTWTGTLQYAGYTFASDADNPLQFIIETDGYHYLQGTGTVTTPDGTQVQLNGGAAPGAPAPTEEQEPTATLEGTGGLETGFKLVFQELFDVNGNQWPTGEDDNDYAKMNWKIKDGVYTWSIESKQGVNWYVHPQVNIYSDFIVSVDLLHVVSSQNDSDAGLLVRKLNDDNFCNFTVDTAGDYAFQCTVDGEWETVLDWAYTTAFNPGETNTITVKGVGEHFTFMINGVVVAEADFDKIDRGKLGLAANVYPEDTTAVFEFDNFEVMAPEE